MRSPPTPTVTKSDGTVGDSVSGVHGRGGWGQGIDSAGLASARRLMTAAAVNALTVSDSPLCTPLADVTRSRVVGRRNRFVRLMSAGKR